MVKKRILIFSLAYYPMIGGAEIAVKEITQRISANEIEWDMVTLRFSRNHLCQEKIGNVNVYRIGGGLGYLSKIFFVLQATLFAFRRKYDACWAIMTNMLFPITLMRLFDNRTPYILTLQDGDPFEHVFKRLRIRVLLPLLKYGFRRASKVQTISNFLAKWAKQMGHKREVEVIPNGVDLEKFSDVKHPVFDKDKVTLITTSRLVEKNGIGDVISALKLLPENVTLKVLGTGPLKENLKFKIKNLKLEDRVKFLGFVAQEEIPKYLHHADIFIRPSLSEGFGISFIEAMAAGLPIIATPVGGILDFLKDGETGLFCEVNNPKSIADKVAEYINHPELTAKIVENAREMVEEKYDWDLIAKEMKTRVFDRV